MISCYTDVLSAAPGEEVSLYISSSGSRCDLEVARLGKVRDVVLTHDAIPTREQSVRERSDERGCDWTVTVSFEIGLHWRSGYHEILIRNELGEEAVHFVCVRAGDRKNRALLILATNTYQAYNWWGGRNSYCDIAAVMDKRVSLLEGLDLAAGVLAQNRPFAQGIIAAPTGVPRLVNGDIRGFGALPDMPSRRFAAQHGLGPLDGPAGFRGKWEHKFAAWAEAREIGLDYATDRDVDQVADLVDGYACVLVVGHSEYWSGPQRDALDAYVERGGKLAIFSGNTSYWKVRWDGDKMVCHKSRGLDREPEKGRDATGLWSHPHFGKPEASLTGLTFLLGGYHRLGMCVARGAGGYTVYNEHHWALAGSDLFYGDQIGSALPLLGYENDGCLIQFSPDGRLAPIPHLGVPENLEIIGMAPVAFAEDPARGYAPILAPEKLGMAASISHGDSGPSGQDRMLRGHAIIGSFEKGAGEVFNCGTTEWANGLDAGDPFVERITLNVLERFGALA